MGQLAITPNDDRLREFMQIAIGLSLDGAKREGCRPFGAVVALGDEVIGKGISSTRLLHDPTAHAEILAIREAAQICGSNAIPDCVLVCSSEPCAMCLSAAYNAQVKLICFACTKEEVAPLGYRDIEIYEQVAKGWAERSIRSIRLPTEAALKILTDYPLPPAV